MVAEIFLSGDAVSEKWVSDGGSGISLLVSVELAESSLSFRRHNFLSEISDLKDTLQEEKVAKAEEARIQASNSGYLDVISWEEHDAEEILFLSSEDEENTGDLSECAAVAADFATRDNERFQDLQKIIASVAELHGENPRMLSLYEEVYAIARDFADVAMQYGDIIIRELHLPLSAKTIKPTDMGGSLGGQKYLVHNVLFKVPEAGLFTHYPDPLWASMKIAGHELKGLKCLWSYQHQRGAFHCHLPLAALVDSRGHRLLAVSVLPISKDTLCYGSDDAGTNCNVRNSDPILDTIVTETCKFLGLKKHLVVDGADKSRKQVGEAEVAGPIDLEGHKGHDGRFYFADFSRLMPPLWKSEKKEYDQGWQYYELMRCEFLLRYGKSLNPDAFSRFASLLTRTHFDQAMSDQNDIKEATSCLLTTHLKTSCQLIVEEWKEGSFCIGSLPLSQKLHFFGINMRFLGKVYECVCQDFGRDRSVDSLPKWIECEAVARVGKNMLRALLRKTHRQKSRFTLGSSDLIASTVEFLSDFVGIIDGDAWRRRNSKVLDDLQSVFHFSHESAQRAVSTFLSGVVNVDSSVSVTARGFVLERLCEMTAVSIVPEVLDALKFARVGFKGRTISLSAVDVRFGCRVKHIEEADHAKGFVLYQQGLSANDASTKMSYFFRAHSALAGVLGSPLAGIRSLILGGHICLRHLVAAAANGGWMSEENNQLGQSAILYFQAAVAEDPFNVLALSSLAELKAVTGDFAGAGEMFSKALELSDRDEEALLKYAQFLKEMMHSPIEADEVMERFVGVQKAIATSSPLFDVEFLEDLEEDDRQNLLRNWKSVTEENMLHLAKAYQDEDWVSIVEVSHSLKGVCSQTGAMRASAVLNRIYFGAKADLPMKCNILDAIEQLKLVVRATCELLNL